MATTLREQGLENELVQLKSDLEIAVDLAVRRTEERNQARRWTARLAEMIAHMLHAMVEGVSHDHEALERLRRGYQAEIDKWRAEKEEERQ